jgi:hypothetical protein
MEALREYDVVRVRQIVGPARDFSGTQGVSREPRVGDVATICHVYDPEDFRAPVAVEMVDEKGMTVWLADFGREELELVSRGSEMKRRAEQGG